MANDSPGASHFQSLVLVVGISGAGKSTALHTFADNGYYIVDNLPVPLLDSFFSLTKDQPQKFGRTALLLDIESTQKVEQLLGTLQRLRQEVSTFQILFLDAKSEILVKRYSETRRPHPEFDPHQDRSILDTVVRERDRLLPIKDKADILLDTSDLTVHDLRREIESFIKRLRVTGTRSVRLNFVSFGFKFGVPLDCDLVMDVRFLPNPHFVEGLRDKSGLEAPVSEFVLQSPITKEFVDRYSALIEFLIPHYVHEGKSYINVGIGCTGGKHRSVAIAEALLRRVSPQNILTSVKHRDLLKS